MSSEVPIWVEVEIPTYKWVKVYALTEGDAEEIVSEEGFYKTTGITTYEQPIGDTLGLSDYYP